MQRNPANSMIPTILRILRRRLPDLGARRLASQYLIAGTYRRIYHYHVRKTGGTSLNHAFWQKAGVDLQNFGDRTIAQGNGIVIVRGEKRRIERGHYFFASSHIPAYALKLPQDTFTITLLRNPLDRLLSYYRYLLWAAHDPQAAEEEPFLNELQPEICCVAGSFSQFLDNAPKRHLLSQLYMFSDNFDVVEAAECSSTVCAVGFTEAFDETIRGISRHLDLQLEVHHDRRFQYAFEVSAPDLKRAREMLDPEFEFLARVRRNRNGRILTRRAR